MTNSGTSSEAVFDFTIPQGATGPAGATGATGPTGGSAVIGGGSPGNNAVNVGDFTGLFTSYQSGIESQNQGPMPRAGTVSNFRVFQPVATGSGNNNVWTVRKNGANTAVTCTVPAAATTCADTTNSVIFAAGDLISIQLTAGTGGGDNRAVRWTAVYGN